MNEKEIIEFLKNNLSIESKKVIGSYGEKGYVEIELQIKGETISTIYIDDND